jgi:hypothetical protein
MLFPERDAMLRDGQWRSARRFPAMFKRIFLSHPHRPTIHLLVVLAAVIAALAILFFVARSAGAADLVEFVKPAL